MLDGLSSLIPLERFGFSTIICRLRGLNWGSEGRPWVHGNETSANATVLP
ncbi:hypothetical protein GCK32_011332 [Trichostrongylus colubriformis]|uniref:Uncharacterized protein n=1 Tax=Trichostrongylus colubriformis TaxID=6319 RepID=A0AAN8FI57_TRICO